MSDSFMKGDRVMWKATRCSYTIIDIDITINGRFIARILGKSGREWLVDFSDLVKIGGDDA